MHFEVSVTSYSARIFEQFGADQINSLQVFLYFMWLQANVIKFSVVIGSMCK